MIIRLCEKEETQSQDIFANLKNQSAKMNVGPF